jgi:hypothetical protein
LRTGQSGVGDPLRFHAKPSNVGTTAKGSRLIVLNPRTVAKPTRSPVKDPGPIDATRPFNWARAKPVSRNNRSIVGNNDLACDPAASCSWQARVRDPSRIATLCHEVAVSTAKTFTGARPARDLWLLPADSESSREK